MKKLKDSFKKDKGTLRGSRKVIPLHAERINKTDIPSQLSKRAGDEWSKVAKTLDEVQLLTELDRNMLMAFCEEMAKYWQYQKDLRTEDIVIKLYNKNGEAVNCMKNPKVDLSDRALKNAKSIGIHFGLTPLSRVKIPGKKKEVATGAASKVMELRSKKVG